MVRRPRHLLPAKLPPRLPLAALLAAWLLALLAPLFHVHLGHAAPEAEAPLAAHAAGHADDSCDDHAGGHCEQPLLPQGQEPEFAASCPDGGDCQKPGHHHHSHETRLHDTTGCSSCASFWERRVEGALPFELAPLALERCAPIAARLSPPAQRAVFAWARGPPATGGSPSRCALPIA